MVGLEILRTSDLFAGLSDEDLSAIAKMAHEQIYDAGEFIFRENDLSDNMYIVSEGRVAILINIGQGKQTVIDTVAPHGSFGWSAMVAPYIRTGSTKTIKQCRIISISGRDLRDLCRVKPGMCYAIMEKLAMIISHRLKHTRLQLINCMRG